MILHALTHKRKHDDKTLDEMYNLHKSGLSYRAIGKKFKLAGSTIYNLLHRWSNMYRPAEEIPNSNMITLEEYCHFYNIQYNTLYYHIKQGNIEAIKYTNKLYVNIDYEIVNKKFISDEKLDELLTFYDMGITNISVLARVTGLARDTVKYYIKEVI